MRSLVVGVVLVAPFLAGAAVGADAPDRAEVAFSFEDPAIVESSGLVVVDDLVVTTNDSGDSGRVFSVDPDTGQTVGTTHWSVDGSTSPVDVEGLAPAGPGHVWVGDIGDNRGSRDGIRVTRVPVGRGELVPDPTSYELRHRGGARDAEALLSHPLTGRLYVATKGVFAGEVSAAPVRLRRDRANELTPVGGVAGIVTDGSFLPGGGAVVLRTYTRAVVHAFPSWEPVVDWELPEQQQGEGVAVDGTDLLLSSEGLRAEVLRVPLPAEAVAADVRGSALWTAWQLLRPLRPA